MLKRIFHEVALFEGGSNAERSAINNRRLVLKTMMADSLVSRSELAQICHLRKQTLTNIIKELIELNLIKEGGRKIEGKGQPKKLLELNPHAVFAIGVHLDQGYIKAVSVDWQGNIRLQHQESLEDWSPEVAIEHIKRIVKNIIDQEKDYCKIFAGIGVSTPNLLDNNLSTYQGSYGWEAWVNFPLQEILEQQFQLPVCVENDATSCAFGHLNTERFKELSHFVSVFIGHGLGGGIITNKVSMKGYWGNAGEVGQIRTYAGLPIEDTLSIRGLKKALSIKGDDIPDKAHLVKRLQQNDDILHAWIEMAAKDLTYLTNILENLFDPETIIISGYLPQELTNILIQKAHPLDNSISNHLARKFDRISLGYSQEGITAKGVALATILM
ncbi:MAG: ROK family protein [Alphaproteobacteria bacterium]